MNPFKDDFFNWLMPLVASRWGVVVVANPPPVEGMGNNIPFVVGNLEAAMPTLASLVEGARNPFPSVLPIRLVMLPGSTVAPTQFFRFHIIVFPLPSILHRSLFSCSSLNPSLSALFLIMISTREEAGGIVPSPAQIFSNQVQGGIGVLVNRPGVDGAVLLTPLLLAD